MEYVQQTITEGIGRIILDRPDKRNALNQQVVAELQATFDAMAADQQVRVIILQANGSVFSAGADLQYLQQLQQNSYEENLADSHHLKDLYRKIYTLPKVVIAEVQGHAIAGGCGLMTVCDFAFAVPEAKFGYTEVKIGFVPAIVMVFLLRKLGEARARELLLGGDLITASRAYEIGLLNKVVPAGELAATTMAFARQLAASNSAASMAYTKKLICQVQDKELSAALDLAAATNAEVRATDDCRQGIAAFLAGKKINW